MEMQPHEVAPAAPPPGSPSLSPWQRAVAVFVRPAQAWSGLESRGQWWFPLVVIVVVGAGLAAALHQRALMPMMAESWEQQVSDGRMTAEAVDRMEAFMGGPVGLCIIVGQQVIIWPIILLVSALGVWFGVGFVLGTKFRYRLAFEAVAWASLITLPAQLLGSALAWSRETMRGLHTGFGIVVPESDPPSKFQTALAFFLDSIGPLSLWYLAVLIIGAAALSGAKRKSVAWVLGGLYVAAMIFFSALGAMFNRGG
jgi:Yip1-like protein